MAPILQNEAYHDFADKRAMCCVPNAMDVASNILFLFVALYHVLCVGGWSIFACGLLATSIGSAYYHLHPTTDRLFFDRLPMTIAFGGAFAPFLGLPPALVASVGCMSVLYWRHTGDLRLYIVYQYGGVLCCGVFTFPVFLYVLAKLCERYDRFIFQITHETISGHTLKHTLAAFACCWLE